MVELLDRTLKARMLPSCVMKLREKIEYYDMVGDLSDGREADGILSEEDFERAKALVPELEGYATFGAFVAYVQKQLHDECKDEGKVFSYVIPHPEAGKPPKPAPVWFSPKYKALMRGELPPIEGLEPDEGLMSIPTDNAWDMIDRAVEALGVGSALIDATEDGSRTYRHHLTNFRITKDGRIEFLPDSPKDFSKRFRSRQAMDGYRQNSQSSGNDFFDSLDRNPGDNDGSAKCRSASKPSTPPRGLRDKNFFKPFDRMTDDEKEAHYYRHFDSYVQYRAHRAYRSAFSKFNPFSLTFDPQEKQLKQADKQRVIKALEPYLLELRREHEMRILRSPLTYRWLVQDLKAVINNPTLSFEEKRRRFFEMWDECTDEPIGLKGKKIISDFIKLNLPAQSPYAYTIGELAELNRRKVSLDTFLPYF